MKTHNYIYIFDIYIYIFTLYIFGYPIMGYGIIKSYGEKKKETVLILQIN